MGTEAACGMQLQAEVADKQSGAAVDEAVAAATEGLEATVKRLKGDVQRKTALLAVAKADADKHAAAAQEAQRGLARAKVEGARHGAEPLRGKAEAAARLMECVHSLAAMALGAASGIRAGAPAHCQLMVLFIDAFCTHV